MSKTPTTWHAGFKTVTVQETDDHVAAEIRVTCGNPDFTRRISRMIAEAGTLYEQTGLAPRQLVEQRDALAEMLKSVIESCEQYGDFRNGVTDPTGTIDEGMVTAAEFFGKARAALALVKGSAP